MSEVLLNFKHQDRGPILCSDFIGKTAPNGVVIDVEMAEGAEVIVDDVLAVCQKHGALQGLLVEQRVHMPQIHPQNWGTLDVAAYLPAIRTIFLWDYKHGQREVAAWENYQLINYVAGLVNLLELNGIDDQEITVAMRVVSPFCYQARGPISEWVVRLSDLRGYFNLLRAKADEALTAPTLSAGLHCRDCSAVGSCPAARSFSYQLIHAVNLPYAMDQMTGADLAVERNILKAGISVAKARLEAIEDDLTHRITAGETGTGLTLESTAGRSKYTVPPKQAIAIAAQFGADISVDACLTPLQSVKAVPADKRAMFEHVLKTVSARSAGALKLIPATDSVGFRAFKPRK
jgi:hypothetical protein